MFKIGADPELFIREVVPGKKDRFISVEEKDLELIPGTKKKPFVVEGGAIQKDGVAAEFNIHPSSTFKEFSSNIHSVVRSLKGRIQAHSPSYHLTPVPTATFSKDYFDKLPAHVLELGCDPDFDAYTDGKPNPRPQTNEPFRTGSGHIHLGWAPNNKDPFEEGHLKDCLLVVKELDNYLLFASEGWDKDVKRRTLYGKAGSFRPKKYGVEYRPLSNAWLNSYETMFGVYYIALGVLRSLDSGKHNVGNKLTNYNKEKNTNMEISLFSLQNYLPEVFKK